MKRHSPFLGLLVLLLAGAAMRVPTLGEKSFWVDEVITARVSRGGVARGIEYAQGDVTPPLSYVWTALAAKFGRSEAAIRLPACLFGLLGLAAMVWVGGLLLERPAGGWVAGALLLLSPFHLHHSQDARMYSAFILFSLLAWGCEYAFWDRWERLGRLDRRAILWPAAWALATLANLYTTYFAFFVLGGQGLHILYHFWKHRTEILRRQLGLGWLVAALVIVLGYLPWLPALLDFLGRSLGEAGGEVLVGWEMLRGIYSTFGPQNAWGSALFALLALLGLIRNLRILRLALFQIAFPLFYLLVLTSSHFFAVRYLAFLLPVYLLAVAAGVLALARWLRVEATSPRLRRVLYGAGASLLLVLVSWPALARYYRLEKQNWREAAAYLYSRLGSGDRVITGRNAVDTCLLHYLAPHPPPARIGILTRIRTPEQLLLQLARPGRIWFVFAWKGEVAPEFLELVDRRFTLVQSYPALTDWGEIYIYLRE